MTKERKKENVSNQCGQGKANGTSDKLSLFSSPASRAICWPAQGRSCLSREAKKPPDLAGIFALPPVSFFAYQALRVDFILLPLQLFFLRVFAPSRGTNFSEVSFSCINCLFHTKTRRREGARKKDERGGDSP
jgi:hypothetical protein